LPAAAIHGGRVISNRTSDEQSNFLWRKTFMTADEFIKRLTELMDTDVVLELSTRLADVEDWDSLSMVSFFSFCNSTLNRRLDPEQIKGALTVEDLFKLAEGKA